MLEGGYHLILDLEGCTPQLLNSKKEMLKLCRDVAGMLNARVIQSCGCKFNPRGVTAFVVIAESHISIHTWPESGKAFMDIFTCKEYFDSDRVLHYIMGALGGKRGRATLLLRNSLFSQLLFNGRIPVTIMDLDFGRTILSTRSPFQLIELTKGPMGLSLFLNGYWQFVEQYEHIYHETLIHPVMICAPRLRKVGIGGGGDGLALREVLKYPRLERVWMYEIDPTMLSVTRNHPEMVRLNRNALLHPKATIVTADAQRMLAPGANFDVLTLDFPSISDGNKFTKLYSAPLYRKAKKALAPDGVLVTQVTDFPWNMAQTIRNLKTVFPHVLPIYANLGNSVFNFVMASPAPFRQRRALPPGLRFIRQTHINNILSPYQLNRKSQLTPEYALG